MAKSKMNIKYKSRKRERNKKKEIDPKSEMKSNIITVISIGLVIAFVYVGVILLEKSGAFEAGYTKPDKVTEISYSDILIGEAFNRNESDYLVLFDEFDSNTYDVYVRGLAEQYESKNIYYVDMSLSPNKNYKSEEVNTNPKNVNDLKINGITLMRVLNGKVTEYITGSENVANYLKKWKKS